MKEPLVWSWGFSFICPECNTWNSYKPANLHEPKRLQWMAGVLGAIVECDDCNSQSFCPLQHWY